MFIQLKVAEVQIADRQTGKQRDRQTDGKQTETDRQRDIQTV